MSVRTHPSRRRGAQRGGRPDLRGTWPARRHPAGRRLPHAADRDDPRRGRGAVPVGPARSGRGARPGNGGGRGAAQGPRRRCRPSCGHGHRGSSSASTSTRPAGSRSASRSPHLGHDGRRRLGGTTPSRSTTAAATDRDPRARAARARPQGGRLVRRGPDRGPDPDVSRLADPRRRGTRPAASNGRAASISLPTGPSRAPRTSARRHAPRW